MGHGINTSKAEQRQPVPTVRQRRNKPEADLAMAVTYCLTNEIETLKALHTCDCECHYCEEFSSLGHLLEVFRGTYGCTLIYAVWSKWPHVKAAADYLDGVFGSSFSEPIHVARLDQEEFPAVIWKLATLLGALDLQLWRAFDGCPCSGAHHELCGRCKDIDALRFVLSYREAMAENDLNFGKGDDCDKVGEAMLRRMCDGGPLTDKERLALLADDVHDLSREYTIADEPLTVQA